MADVLSLSNRKRLIGTAAALIVAAAILFIAVPLIARAAAIDEGVDWKGWIADTVMQMGSDEADELLGINSGYEEKLTELATKVASAFEVIVVGAAIILTIVSITKEIAMGHNTFEMWIRALTKLVFGIAIVAFTIPIIGYLEEGGKWLFHEVARSMNNLSGDASKNIGEFLTELEPKMEEAIKADQSSLFTILESPTELIICGVLAIFLRLYMKLMSYALMIEIALRKAFASVATLSVIHGGMRSVGFRYFRKFFALYIRMTIILITFKIGALIAINTSFRFDGAGSVFLALIEGFIIMGACTSFMNKSIGVANEIAGV